VVVVEAVEFHQKGVFAGYEMAFDDFGYLAQGGDDFVILAGFREGDADEGADVEAEGLGFDQQPGSGNDAIGFQSFHALVDGCAGNAAFTGDLKERHSRILYEEAENLLVSCVDVVICHSSLQFISLVFAKITKLFKKRIFKGAKDRFIRKNPSK
jgi:hypothetical protein